MKKTILELSLPVSILWEGEKYIAYTPALDLSTSGKNFDEAKKRFNEIVHLFFEEIIKKNTIEEVLGGLGWQKIDSKWNPPIVVANESQNVTLSF